MPKYRPGPEEPEPEEKENEDPEEEGILGISISDYYDLLMEQQEQM